MLGRVGVSKILGRSPALFGAHFEQSTFSLGSHKGHQTGVLVGLFECSRVQGDRHVNQIGKFRGDIVLEFGEVESRSEVFSVQSLLIGSFGIGSRVNTAGVLGHVTNDLSIDKGSADNGHLIGGQCTGLIGADDRGGSHGFTTSEDTDQQILLCHSLGGESQSEGNGKRQTFGHSHDNQCDGNDQNFDEVLTLFVTGSVRLGLKLDEESDHEGEEELRRCQHR